MSYVFAPGMPEFSYAKQLLACALRAANHGAEADRLTEQLEAEETTLRELNRTTLYCFKELCIVPRKRTPVIDQL